VRLNFYTLRKEWMIKKLNYDKLIANNKKIFIEMQLSNQLTIHRKDVKIINEELKQLKFTTQTEFNKLKDELEKNLKSTAEENDDSDELNMNNTNNNNINTKEKESD